ncbi:MAG: glycoside hydrolase family 15 protein [Anaerolineae bacterium]|nr:glycoside hydrolase family 15 protein [Anaerolineae bacterium]
MNTSPALYRRSLRVLLENQQPGGAYLACPNMPDYRFSWFRDGAYIAYALTLDGADVGAQHSGVMDAQWASAGRFHNWCADVVNRRADAVARSIERAKAGAPPIFEDTLNTRYLADGQAGPAGWPEFQLDGPGTWLWSLWQYVTCTRLRPLPAAWAQAADLVARYLAALWQTPCYDCWEERGDAVHISTLGAIYAGLAAAEHLLGVDFGQTRQAIRAFVLDRGLTPHGELAKSVGLDMVDANLISVSVPHALLPPDDPIMRKTIARIEHDLHAPGSGVYRHLEDTYYGGGPWVLLALWLAWYYFELGDAARASALTKWAEAQANATGNLPEQVNDRLLAPAFYAGWVAQRGPIASPLLWSHAKYLIVRQRSLYGPASG